MPERSYPYVVVDVFTDVPFAGNPLAVFPDARGLSDDEMQMLARELNLSESAFVFPPRDSSSAAKLRLFTPGKEIPFAGHPTIGTSFVLVERGRAGGASFVLEENVGPIAVRVERAADPFMAWLSTPPIRFEQTLDAEAAARTLGLERGDLLDGAPPQVVSAGNPFFYVALRERAAVDRAELDVRAFQRLLPDPDVNGVFIFAPTEGGVYSRMVAPMSGVREDPATGSATGPLGAYLAEYGLIEARDGARFTSEQGVQMKRRSLLHGLLHYRNGTLQTVEVGGSAVHVIDATVAL